MEKLIKKLKALSYILVLAIAIVPVAVLTVSLYVSSVQPPSAIDDGRILGVEASRYDENPAFSLVVRFASAILGNDIDTIIIISKKDKDDACDCEKGMVELSVRYEGASGVDVNVYLKKNQKNLIKSFVDVQNGDVLVVDPADAGKDKLEKSTFFEVVDGDETEIHTSCSKDIFGGSYGDFMVIDYVDKKGNVCSEYEVADDDDADDDDDDADDDDDDADDDDDDSDDDDDDSDDDDDDSDDDDDDSDDDDDDSDDDDDDSDDDDDDADDDDDDGDDDDGDDDGDDDDDDCEDDHSCEEPTIKICHATGSEYNPYLFLIVGESSVDGKGKNDHTHHEDDIIPAVDLNGDKLVDFKDCYKIIGDDDDDDDDDSCVADGDPNSPLSGTDYTSFIFNFEEGLIGSGTSEKNEAHLSVGEYEMDVHVSCSDGFEDGYGEKGDPTFSEGHPRIESYTIWKYKYDKKNDTCELKKMCGDEPVVPQDYDFGDVPDGPYPTLLANNGARHTVGSGVFLGSSVDEEPDGQPDVDALGDGDDEDGITFTSAIVPGTDASMTIEASDNGFLDGWIDYGADGSWAEPGDRIFTALPLLPGINQLLYPVPESLACGSSSYARFRYSSVGNVDYTGHVTDGEVEDYLVEFAGVMDLMVEIVDLVDPIQLGEDIDYVITVTNVGCLDATNVQLNHELPGDTVFVEAVPEQGVCTENIGVLGCGLGDIPVGESVDITVKVTPNSEGVYLTDVEVSADEEDSDPANNIDDEDTTVGNVFGLRIDKIDLNDPVKLGSNIHYVVTATNNGPTDANNTVVTDTLPAGLNFVSAVSSQGVCAEDAGLITCELGLLELGGVVTINITVTPQSKGVFTDVVVITSDEEDPNPEDNTADEDTTVTSGGGGGGGGDDDDDDPRGAAEEYPAPEPEIITACLEYYPFRDLSFDDLGLAPTEPADFARYIEFLKGVRIREEIIGYLQYIISGYGSFEGGNTGTAFIGPINPTTRMESVKIALTSNCIQIYEPGELPLNGPEFPDLPRTNYSGSTHDNPYYQDVSAEDLDFATRVMYSGYDIDVIHGLDALIAGTSFTEAAAPWEYATRAELFKIYTNAAGLIPEELKKNITLWEQIDATQFAWQDVTPADWFYEHAKIARYYEIVSDAPFAYPNRPANRAELFVLTTRVMYIVRDDIREAIGTEFFDEAFVQDLAQRGLVALKLLAGIFTEGVGDLIANNSLEFRGEGVSDEDLSVGDFFVSIFNAF